MKIHMNRIRRNVAEIQLLCTDSIQLDAKSALNPLRRYVTGFSWTLFGTLAGQASTYLSTMLMARFLGLESFGRLGTVQATLTAVFGVAALGLGITSTRYITRYRVSDPARAGRLIGLCSLVSLCSGTLFTVVLLLFADLVANHLFRNGHLSTAIRITAPYCALMTMNAHQIGTLLGFQAYGRLLRAQALQGATTLLLTFTLVSTLGFNGAVLTLPLSAVFAWLYMHLEVAAECRTRSVHATFRGAWSERKVLLEFALPASFSGVIGSVAVWTAQGLLVRNHDGIQQMGLWTAAVTLRSMVLLAPGVLSRVSSPILSSLHDHETGESYSRTLWSTTAIATVGAMATALALIAVGPWVLTLFGRTYKQAESLLPLVLGSAVVEVFAGNVGQVVVADTRMKYQILVIILWGFTLTLVAYLAIPNYHAQGLASGYLASAVVSAIVYTLIARKFLLQRGRGSLVRQIPQDIK